MTIFLNILFLIIGIILLIKGADFFVDGASEVAKKFKIPSFVIGLTVVAIGTSLPELSVSISSALSGSSDLALGNVIGSNFSNTLLILGFSSLFTTLKLAKKSTKIELSFLLTATFLSLLFSADTLLNGQNNQLNRTEGIVLLLLFIFYMFIVVFNALKDKKEDNEKTVEENDTNSQLSKSTENQPNENKKNLKIWQIIIYLVLGLAAVVFGGECVCTTSQFIALQLGMSEALVGLTIVAVGTSLPELVTSIIAAKKGESGLALGNVIGSNIGNISLILGLSSIIKPAHISLAVLTDTLILFVVTTFFSIILAKKKEINKTFGIILIITYIFYLTFAIIRNYCF